MVGTARVAIILLQNGFSRWWYMALFLERPGGNGRILGAHKYKEIKAPEKLYYEDYFSDKDGNLNQQMPSTLSKPISRRLGGATIVKSTATYRSKEDLQKVIDMGMTAGIEETLDRLDEYMEKLVAAN